MWLLSLQVYWKKKEDEFSESLARLPSQAGSVGHGTRQVTGSRLARAAELGIAQAEPESTPAAAAWACHSSCQWPTGSTVLRRWQPASECTTVTVAGSSTVGRARTSAAPGQLKKADFYRDQSNEIAHFITLYHFKLFGIL
jgi:hypothetical protein